MVCIKVYDPWKSAGSHIHPDNRLALYFDTEQCLLSFVVQSEDEYECNSCEDICPSQDFTLMHFQRYKMLCLFILLLIKMCLNNPKMKIYQHLLTTSLNLHDFKKIF